MEFENESGQSRQDRLAGLEGDLTRFSSAVLRKSMSKMMADLPVGAVLSDESGRVCYVAEIEIRVSRVPSNDFWDAHIKGRGHLTDTRGLLAAAAPNFVPSDYKQVEYYDGNHHLGLTSERETCAVAARIPEALRRYRASTATA
jgi:hypothetical protein